MLTNVTRCCMTREILKFAKRKFNNVQIIFSRRRTAEDDYLVYKHEYKFTWKCMLDAEFSKTTVFFKYIYFYLCTYLPN